MSIAYNVNHLYIYLEPCWSQSAFVYIMPFIPVVGNHCLSMTVEGFQHIAM